MSEVADPSDWKVEALRLWARGGITAGGVAEAVGRPFDEVAPVLAEGTYAAVYQAADSAQRSVGWK